MLRELERALGRELERLELEKDEREEPRLDEARLKEPPPLLREAELPPREDPPPPRRWAKTSGDRLRTVRIRRVIRPDLRMIGLGESGCGALENRK